MVHGGSGKLLSTAAILNAEVPGRWDRRDRWPRGQITKIWLCQLRNVNVNGKAASEQVRNNYVCLLLFPPRLFLGLHPQHMEIPKLGVESELQLLAYSTATATAMWDRSHVCNLHHNSRQHWIPDPLSEARDRTRVLMDTSLLGEILKKKKNTL